MEKKKFVSIVVPVFNEERNILKLYLELIKTLSRADKSFEIIFVNDGSQDKSQFEIKKIKKIDSRVRLISLTRNFGKELATTAGINHSLGDACIIIDADLQHPPFLIPEFIKKWEEGASVVIGVRKSNKGEGLIKKAGSKMFYKIMNKISETRLVPNATDYRLLDRTVIDEFNKFSERNRMTRALIDWLGFDTKYLYFDAGKRVSGRARYSNFKLLRLAINSMVSFSLFPLKIAGYLGIFITFLSLPLGIFILIEKYILNDPLNLAISGPATLAVILLFLVGIVLICLGLIALYIANIHNEVINRPLYVIKKSIRQRRIGLWPKDSLAYMERQKKSPLWRRRSRQPRDRQAAGQRRL